MPATTTEAAISRPLLSPLNPDADMGFLTSTGRGVVARVGGNWETMPRMIAYVVAAFDDKGERIGKTEPFKYGRIDADQVRTQFETIAPAIRERAASVWLAEMHSFLYFNDLAKWFTVRMTEYPELAAGASQKSSSEAPAAIQTDAQTFDIERVWWNRTTNAGYCFTARLPARILRASATRARIAYLVRDPGSKQWREAETTVKRTSLEPRSTIETHTAKEVFPEW